MMLLNRTPHIVNNLKKVAVIRILRLALQTSHAVRWLGGVDTRVRVAVPPPHAANCVRLLKY